ncbi:HAD family hydrolase [Pontiellaceae bacterium B12227]|nr:HAD family hydrolase [Pontiellaceae bacterium B12227]
MKWIKVAVLIISSSVLAGCATSNQQASLELWNEGAAKASIVDFVQAVTDESSPDYLPPAERIATFDMDGTILIEKPMYVVFGFALEQMAVQMENDPSLKNKQPFKAVAEKDMEYFHGNMYGTDGLFDVLLYATDGMTDEAYTEALNTYLAKPHPRFGKSPNELLYAPVLELVDYLLAHDFKVYICSGSDPEFTRIAAAGAVGLPPEHIIGTMVLAEWNGEAFIRKHEFIHPINDQAGKPVNIRNKIGRVPVVAVGNSRGDLEMLNYSKTAGHSLQLIVNHDDPDREYEYSVDKMKKLCAENDWIEVSMKDDFKTVFED